MKIGLIRLSPAGPGEKTQRAALKGAGITDFRKVGPGAEDARDVAIEALGRGDVLVVASPGCLGTTASDVLAVLAQITRREASVMDASTGEMVVCPSEALPALDFANRADSENRRAIAAKARRARAETGRMNQWPGWTEDRVKRLKSMAADGRMTRDEMADDLGVSRSTVQRKLREIGADPSALDV